MTERKQFEIETVVDADEPLVAVHVEGGVQVAVKRCIGGEVLIVAHDSNDAVEECQLPDTDWIEGIPDKTGDYWIYTYSPNYSNGSRIRLGFAAKGGDGSLIVCAGEMFIFREKWKLPRRIFYKAVTLPKAPEVKEEES